MSFKEDDILNLFSKWLPCTKIDTLNEVLRLICKKWISTIYMHPVTGHIVRKDKDPEKLNKYVLSNLNHQETEIKVLPEAILGLRRDTILAPEVRMLRVTSNCTGNSDSRGGGCGDLNIPISEFDYTIKCKNGLTLQHLIEGVYRMKGSKYDWWYELFQCIKFEGYENETLHISTFFDYGS